MTQTVFEKMKTEISVLKLGPVKIYAQIYLQAPAE